MRFRLELEAQVIANGLRRAQSRAAIERLPQRSPAHFEHRVQLRVFRIAQTAYTFEAFAVRAQERRKRPAASEHAARKIDRVESLHSRA